MDACTLGGAAPAAEGSFDELWAAMQKDSYWIRFFALPCCPAPDLAGAEKMLDKLKAEALARPDLTEGQRQQLADLIEGRKAWYGTSGLCRKAS